MREHAGIGGRSAARAELAGGVPEAEGKSDCSGPPGPRFIRTSRRGAGPQAPLFRIRTQAAAGRRRIRNRKNISGEQDRRAVLVAFWKGLSTNAHSSCRVKNVR